MAEPVVLDANVIVGLLYEQDAKHADAVALLERVQAAGQEADLLDVLVLEAMSVLARRAAERKTTPPDLEHCVRVVQDWHRAGLIHEVAGLLGTNMRQLLAIIADTGGKLNANDAFLVVLQRLGVIEEVATFDENLAAVSGFRRFA